MISITEEVKFWIRFSNSGENLVKRYEQMAVEHLSYKSKLEKSKTPPSQKELDVTKPIFSFSWNWIWPLDYQIYSEIKFFAREFK